MTRTFLGLFRQAPFGSMKQMMTKVKEAVDLLPALIESANQEDSTKLKEIAKLISLHEHEADVIKNEIRDHLPKFIFLPVDRSDLLDVLHCEDAIADTAEDVAVLYTLRNMPYRDFYSPLLDQFLKQVLAAFAKVVELVNEFDRMAEAGFSGAEAERVLKMIDEVCHEEHLADKIQDMLAKCMFEHEDDMKPVEVFMWSKIFNKLGDIANNSEKLANRIRLLIAK